MTTILGLFMIYAWVHSIVIVTKKTENLTSYETFILIVSVSAFALYIMGTIAK